MEKPRSETLAICSVVSFLGLIAIAACLAAEFRKNKVKDLKLDVNLCFLPESPVFGLGIAASICLSLIQIIVGSIIAFKCCSKRMEFDAKSQKLCFTVALFLLSWVSYAFGVVLLSVGTSMSRQQEYGKGWLDGECYIVKDGVFAGAASLAFVTLTANLSLYHHFMKTTMTGGQGIK
ncbi:uncharacterized protein LOC18422679 [Amborella trichopoda]|uniref:Uncharacterized protein n=1 Tax=Amborella trichopoda TaxID=13333 RepID=W1NG59_AMBTC|nr:uncharacterized protein LOC18422679 [Amborella trichopoda]ERM94772.1 hypothetical protein AMTR_s00011p00261920 [Amborella trichopoda]|eukprot:XP_006878627.1 uncharacterized protein LOC18422679 [Amborella trichopoda]